MVLVLADFDGHLPEVSVPGNATFAGSPCTITLSVQSVMAVKESMERKHCFMANGRFSC